MPGTQVTCIWFPAPHGLRSIARCGPRDPKQLLGASSLSSPLEETQNWQKLTQVSFSTKLPTGNALHPGSVLSFLQTLGLIPGSNCHLAVQGQSPKKARKKLIGQVSLLLQFRIWQKKSKEKIHIYANHTCKLVHISSVLI